MKILLDANLSWRLSKLLSGYCEEVVHVEKTNLNQPAKDFEIWQYAKQNEFVIATHDEDFLNLLLSKGFPPKLILLRSGNLSSLRIAQLFNKHKEAIESLDASDEIGVLEIFKES